MKKKFMINSEWDEIFNSNKENNFSNHAFPLFLFTERLYEEVENKNIKNVLFMSREGQFLKKLFDKYCDIRRELKLNVVDVNTHYFYGSRNSIMTASNRPIDEENFESLLKFFHFFMSPAQFLFSIGFNENQIDLVRKEMGKKLDKKCFDLKSAKFFKKMLKNAVFTGIYEENRKSQGNALAAYINSFNLDYKNEGFTFVDIGYHGTMQDLIFKFLDKKVTLNGYFIKSRSESVDNNYKTGLLSDSCNKKLLGLRINKYDAYNYEQILRADHGRCTGYEIKNNVGSPVIDTKLKDKELFDKYVKKMQDDIYDKFVKIAHKKLSENAEVSAICIIYYYYLVKYKTKADYKWIIDMQDSHHDDFGYVGYPGRAFARWLRKFVFKLKDKLFIFNNSCYIRKLKKKI